jgi:Trypsin-like peptidase domain/CHAT domain
MTGIHRLQEELLPASVARIDIQGTPNGSGFFVTPTDVLTCRHVLFQQERIEVVDWSGKRHQVLDAPVLDDAADLAWIKLAAPVADVQAALLGDAFSAGDVLYCYGYPAGKAPEPATFEVEGRTGSGLPRIKFKGGQAKPGVSGSPLLNTRTGAVCAILGSRRDSDLGGYGIPVTVLLARPGFGVLRARNQQAQAADRRWPDLLTADQRRTAGLDRLAGPDPSVGLVIDVQRRADGWNVSATWLPDGDGAADQTVDLNLVRSRAARLFRAWRSQQRIGDTDQARILGEVLYRSIFPAEVAAEFERRVRERIAIDISLHFADAVDDDLKYLPWEQLHTPFSATSRQMPMGTDLTLTLARVLTAEPGRPAAPDRADLTIAPITAPLHLQAGTLPPCAREVCADLRDLTDIAHLQVRPVEAPDEGRLRQLCSASPGDAVADVLHYIGYGRLSGTIDEIALSGDWGEPRYVGPDDFADCVADRPPRLVVLQTCSGPEDLRQIPGDLSEFAIPLLKAGVRAVVVFQFPLARPAAAKTFNRSFYQQLMNGAPVRAAMQRARNDLGADRWALPALFERWPGRFALVSDEIPAGQTVPRSLQDSR